jgi:hypothetical protein
MDPGLLEYIASEVLSKENVRGLIDRSVIDLADAPDSIMQDRAELEATIVELDRKIRLVGQSVIDGIIAPADAKALNAPMIAQRETAQLKLASMPQRRVLLAAEKADPEKFRDRVLQAWTDKPLELRREALDRLLERVTLDEGGVHVQYAVKDEPPFRHQAPAGPAWVLQAGRCRACFNPRLHGVEAPAQRLCRSVSAPVTAESSASRRRSEDRRRVDPPEAPPHPCYTLPRSSPHAYPCSWYTTCRGGVTTPPSRSRSPRPVARSRRRTPCDSTAPLPPTPPPTCG